jgi:hypothetical protein
MLSFCVLYVLFNVYARLSAEVIEKTPKQFHFIQYIKKNLEKMFVLRNRYG